MNHLVPPGVTSADKTFKRHTGSAGTAAEEAWARLGTDPPKPVQRQQDKTLVQGLGETRPRHHQTAKEVRREEMFVHLLHGF